MDKTSLFDRFENAARRLRPTATAVAMSTALLASTSPAAQAEGADAYEAADVTAQVEATALTSAEALERALAADPDSLSETLRASRFEDRPDFLPGSGEAEAIVWNQTGNWMVAVNEDGRPVYLPDDFSRLDVVTIGSLSERFDHFDGLKDQLPGSSMGEKVKNDETFLALGNVFPQEIRDDIATVLRQELFETPAAGYEESLERVNEHFGRDRDEPNFLDRATDRAKRRAEWEARRQVDDAVEDAIDTILGGGR